MLACPGRFFGHRELCNGTGWTDKPARGGLGRDLLALFLEEGWRERARAWGVEF